MTMDCCKHDYRVILVAILFSICMGENTMPGTLVTATELERVSFYILMNRGNQKPFASTDKKHFGKQSIPEAMT